MSRPSLAAFLSKAKHTLSQSLRKHEPATFVIGNQSADLDSITCAVVYGYIQSHTAAARKTNRVVIPITNIPSDQLRLRPELTALLKKVELKPSDLITLDDLGDVRDSLEPEKTQWTLVDHNVLLGELGERFSHRVNGVIDHHEDEHRVPEDAEPRIIEKTGSCNSLVVNYCRGDWDEIAPSSSSSSDIQDATDAAKSDIQLSFLALAAILIDTVNLKAEDKITHHDRRAIEYLEKRIRTAAPALGIEYDRDAFFKEINDAKSNLDDLSLDEILQKDYKEWTEGQMTLGISSAVRSMEYLRGKEKDGRSEARILEFAKGRELDLFAVMTAHNDSKSFARQLLLMAADEGKAKDVAEKFVERYEDELGLKDSPTKIDPESVWMRMWEQEELSASRKRVAPMLREVMKGSAQ